MSTEAARRDRVTVTGAEICEILVTRTGVDPDVFPGNEHLSLKELEIDSLAVLELQAIIVRRYGVEIPAEAIGMTVPEIAALVNESLEEVS
jgi:acyl carrier protein